MNCKQGDLAMIVQSIAGNEGKIVRCLRLLPEYADGHGFFSGPRWRVDRPLPSSVGNTCQAFADQCLRPIRGAEGEDEILRITGLPQPILEKA